MEPREMFSTLDDDIESLCSEDEEYSDYDESESETSMGTYEEELEAERRRIRIPTPESSDEETPGED